MFVPAPRLRAAAALLCALASTRAQPVPARLYPMAAAGRMIRSSTTFAIYWQPASAPQNGTKFYLSSCGLCPTAAANICVGFTSPGDPYIDALSTGPSFSCSMLPYALTGYQAGAPAPRLGINPASSGVSSVAFALTGAGAAPAWTFATGGNILASPAVDAVGVVYIQSADKFLYAFNASYAVGVSGASRLLWKFSTNVAANNGQPGGGYATPTLGSNNFLYIGGAGMFALDLNGQAPGATPPVAWAFNDSGAMGSVYSSVSLDTSTAGATVGFCYFGASNGIVYALDCRVGVVVWRYQTRLPGNTSGVASSPLYVNGLVIVGTENGFVLALYAVNGTKAWQFVAGGMVKASPIFSGGGVFIADWKGIVNKLDAATGALLWQYNAGTTSCGTQIESMGAVSSDGSTLLIGSNTCSFYSLSTATGALKSMFAVTQSGWFNNPPVIDRQGLVYSGMGSAACRVNVWNVSTGAPAFNISINSAISTAAVALASSSMLFFGGYTGVFYAYAPTTASTSPTSTASGTASATQTPSVTAAVTPSLSAAATTSVSPGASSSGTAAATVSASLSTSNTYTSTGSASGSSTATMSPSAAATSSSTASAPMTASSSASASTGASAFFTSTLSLGASASTTPAATATLSRGASASSTTTGSFSPRGTPAASPSSAAAPADASVTATPSLASPMADAPATAAAASSSVAPIAAGAGAGVLLLAAAAAAVVVLRRRREQRRAPVATRKGGDSSSSGGGGGGGGGNKTVRGSANPLLTQQQPSFGSRAAGDSTTGSVRALAFAPSTAGLPAPLAATAARAPAVNGDGLLPGWVEVFSKSKQQYYYRHAVTGETSWDKPVAAADKKVAAPVAAVPTAAEAPLPAGWTQCFSRSKQTNYWRHEDGRTSWSRPG